jgi:hypothetical protein
MSVSGLFGTVGFLARWPSSFGLQGNRVDFKEVARGTAKRFEIRPDAYRT